MGYSNKSVSMDFRHTDLKFIFLSPHFPPRFRYFIRSLRHKGVTVLGIGDERYDALHDEVRENLQEYFRIPTMDDYDQVYKAVGYFIHKYGRIHFVESLNEHWLELEARLRLDFNIPGYKPTQMDSYKRKSGMKGIFQGAGLDVAPGCLASTLEEALQFGKAVGYPLIMKPDIGVGAFGARKISNEGELREHWQGIYYLEQFVKGDIETYDGLCDCSGNITFDASLGYSSGIMEILLGDTESILFYVKKDIPDDLRDLGLKVVKAFDVKNRFFHVEFFRTTEGKLLPLEMNLRPPGGITVDLWNYAYQMDLYGEYANVIAGLSTSPFKKQPLYIGAYSGRRTNIKYKRSYDDIVKHLGKKFQIRIDMPEIFSHVMGNEAYVYLCDTIQEMRGFVTYIDEKEKSPTMAN